MTREECEDFLLNSPWDRSDVLSSRYYIHGYLVGRYQLSEHNIVSSSRDHPNMISHSMGLADGKGDRMIIDLDGPIIP